MSRGQAVPAFPTIQPVSRVEYCLIALFTSTLICRAGCVKLFPPPLPSLCGLLPLSCWIPPASSYTIFITAHCPGGAGAEFGFVRVIKQRTCSLSTPQVCGRKEIRGCRVYLERRLRPLASAASTLRFPERTLIVSSTPKLIC